MTLPHELPRHFCAISIEALGNEDNANGATDKGWLITTEGARPYAQTIESRTEYEVKPWLIFDSLDVAEEGVEIFESKVTWGAVSGEMQATDEAAKRLLHTQFVGSSVVSSRIGESDTTIELDDAGLTLQVIYIGDEAIELISDNGGGSYDVNRGVYETNARAHEVDAPVFDTVPYYDARRVKFFTGKIVANNPSGADDPGVVLNQRMLSLLVGNVRQERGRLQWKTRAAGARLQEFEAGKQNRRLPDDSLWADDDVVNSQGLSVDDYTYRIRKPEVADNISDGGVQIKDFAVPADLDTDTFPTPNEARGIAPSGVPVFQNKSPKQALDVEDEEDPRSDIQNPAFEVFLVHSNDADDVSPIQEIADTLGEDYRYHRLTYYAAFHLSTRQTTADVSSFDVLQPDWSLNAKPLFVDTIVDDLKSMIEKYQNEREFVDRIILGKDNETVELRKFCVRKLLHPFYHEVVNQNGELEVKRTKSPDVSNVDTATGEPITALPSQVLSQDPGRNKTKNAAQVDIGSTDLTEGRSVFIKNNKDLNQRWQELNNSRKLEVDASVVDPKGQETPAIVGRVIDQLQLQAQEHPELTILAPDAIDRTEDYNLGSWVDLSEINLSPEWIVDTNQNRVSNFSGFESVGLIVRRKLNIAEKTRSRSYRLSVLFLGHLLSRFRAPSAKIQEISTNDDGNNNTHLEVGGDSGGISQFGLPNKDASYFDSTTGDSDGDEVEIVRRDFVSAAGGEIKEVVDIDTSAGNNTVVVNGTYSTTPSTGQYVRLAHLDTDGSGTGYENKTVVSAVDRAYIFLAESDGTLGSDELDADTYAV